MSMPTPDCPSPHAHAQTATLPLYRFRTLTSSYYRGAQGIVYGEHGTSLFIGETHAGNGEKSPCILDR